MTDAMVPHPPAKRPLLWPDWVLDLQDLLLSHDGLPDVYIVGGAVRDALRHHPVKDVDLATQTDAIRLARLITDALDGDIFVMDAERGVARVFYKTPLGERFTLDVANFRGETLLEDLSDRDFTVNAMAVDFLGDLSLLIDPLNGEKDVHEKIMRRCNLDAIANDPIRVLRGIRQSVQFSMRIERETLADMREQSSHILQTSPERIRDEVFAVLALDRPQAAWRVANAIGVIDVILPPMQKFSGQDWDVVLSTIERLTNILLAVSPRRTDSTAAVFDLGMMVMQFDRYRARLNEHLEHTWANDRPTRSLLILCALLYRFGTDDKGLEFVSICVDALRLSTPEKKRLLAYIQAATQILSLMDATDLTVHRYWYQWGEAGVGAVLVALAIYRAETQNELSQAAWLELIDKSRSLLAAYYDLHDEIVSPPVLVDGNALIETFGLKRGPVIGELLTVIREAQVTKQVVTTQDALDLAAGYLAQRANYN